MSLSLDLNPFTKAGTAGRHAIYRRPERHWNCIETEPVVDLIRQCLRGVGTYDHIGIHDLIVARGEKVFDMPESASEIAAQTIVAT